MHAPARRFTRPGVDRRVTGQAAHRTPREIAVAVTITVLLLVAWFAVVYVTVKIARYAWFN